MCRLVCVRLAYARKDLLAVIPATAFLVVLSRCIIKSSGLCLVCAGLHWQGSAGRDSLHPCTPAPGHPQRARSAVMAPAV